MSGLHTSTVREAHAYTRSKSPWIIDEIVDPDRKLTGGARLMHYISGGGMRTFGRTVQQEEAHRRHRRFIAVSCVLAFLWLVFYII